MGSIASSPSASHFGWFNKTMSAKPKLLEARLAKDFAAGRLLFEEYAASLRIDLSLESFDSELDQLPEMYGAPSGCLFLARLDEFFIGCGGVRRLSERVCEIKRLYVRPAGRGMGVGRALAMELVQKAAALGYSRIVLDSLVEMTSAQKLYHTLGFRDTPPYYDNPRSGFVYMALDIQGHGLRGGSPATGPATK
jgi:ribosomal protein S18 acetylase RimI-like enzyme